MRITQWDPFREVSLLSDNPKDWLLNFFVPANDDCFFTHETWVPPVDIYQNSDNELVLTAELPGIKLEDISVTVANDVLTLCGQRKFEHDNGQNSWQRMERNQGKFSRSFSLPATVNPEAVNADYKDGTLVVRLPLREEAKPKQIVVRAA